MYVVIDRATQVPKDALDEILVHVAWSMHEETCLVNCICNVRSRESEALQRTCNAAVERGIHYRGSLLS